MLLAALGVAAVAGVSYLYKLYNRLPGPGSEVYEQATRAFYRGLASLEVGLLNDAKREFTDVTTRVPEEPAAWANLGLSHLRLGELDDAVAPIERARKLAPENADVELLAGRMEIARGRLEEGLAHLRRAVELAPDALQSRFALAEEVENAAPPDADAQALADALALLDELAKLAPRNMAVLAERARLAARAQDRQRLVDSLNSLKPLTTGWPAEAAKLFETLQQEVSGGTVSALTATSFRNVLIPVPAYREDLSAIRTPAELISEPLPGFLALVPPPATPAARDLRLTFAAEPAGEPLKSRVFSVAAMPSDDDGAPPQLLAVEFERVTLLGSNVQLPFPSRLASESAPDASGVAVVDWNNDFRRDIVMAGVAGIKLFIQEADRTFVDRTPAEQTAATCVCRAVWPADIEMDGDIDLVAAPHEGAPFVLRNTGDGQWTAAPMFDELMNVTQFAWADIDTDGDPDAVFLASLNDAIPRLHVYGNRQAGDFVKLREMPVTSTTFTVADIDADGAFDLLSLERTGEFHAASFQNGQWNVRPIATWPNVESMFTGIRLLAADYDNNGALDLLATGQEGSRLWLSDPTRQLLLHDEKITGNVFPAGDLNADGRVDLTAVAPIRMFDEPYRALRLTNRGSASYHWKQISFRAQPTAGDQRINSFAIGGFVEARAGLLFQKQLLTGGPVHVGLGTQASIDVARIVWPNGIPQAEFGVKVDDGMVVEQRLKGSCPWIFTWDGTRMVFVTDFLWRSPLGLRINAQDTAGVTQTEDWVRLRGDQLVPRNGRYDVRITAELWETHFFDHVSLMAVDHPDGTEVFVDERFSPASPPSLGVHTVKDLRPAPKAWDHRGVDVSAAVARRDGQYLSTFSRGRYQGIAEEHFVEVGLDGRADVLIASGWIYPTDSSINVAIAQAGIVPRGLSLEARNADGSWRMVNADLGFPAGKNKTLVIDLRAVGAAERIRLRTNLEIYWDALQLGKRVDAPVRTTRIAASGADLRYRGFSHTVSPRGSAPETPEYDRIASTSPRWRDLTGYHTRFGDVRELIEQVDDRYVIMNAGDELRLQFPEAPAVANGWRRDFVLIGDGWEKDGDYNTLFSETVLPLPAHDRPDYGAQTTSLALEDDPVYQRHRGDWQRFHTRYVTPRRFLDGLRSARRN